MAHFSINQSIKSNLAIPVIFVGAIGFSSSAVAQVTTNARISYLTNFTNYGQWTVDSNADIYNYDAINSSSGINSYQRDFSVLDSQNNPAITSFTGSANASATHSSLSAYARTTVVNPVPLGSNQQYIDNSGNLIPSGMPEGFSSNARASMSDAILIESSDVASIQFKLGFEGSVSGIDDGDWNRDLQWGSTQIDMYAKQANGNWQWSNVGFESYNGVFDPSDWSWDYPTKTFQEEYLSNLIPIVNGVASFEFSLDSSAEIRFRDSLIEGGTFDVTADFANTLTIMGVYAFDSNGNLLNSSLLAGSEHSLLGQSGTAYSVLAAPVPLPPSFVMLGLGLASLVGVSRRRS